MHSVHLLFPSMVQTLLSENCTTSLAFFPSSFHSLYILFCCTSKTHQLIHLISAPKRVLCDDIYTPQQHQNDSMLHVSAIPQLGRSNFFCIVQRLFYYVTHCIKQNNHSYINATVFTSSTITFFYRTHRHTSYTYIYHST